MIDTEEQKEILLKLRDLHAVFLGIDGQPGQFALLSAQVKQHDDRLRVTERFQYVLTGMGLVASFAFYKLSALVGILTGTTKALFLPVFVKTGLAHFLG
jgi:hypothetical protein